LSVVSGKDQCSLEGKTALVTGGAGGIGRATSLVFASAGASVVVVDFDADGGNATVAMIREAGGTAHFIRADVSQAEDVERYARETVHEFGPIDVFFNNAGIMGQVSPLIDYPVEMFDRVLEINVRGTFLGLKYVLPQMIERKMGSIINTASVGGTVGSPGLCAYVASKHAIIGLTRTAAGEVAQHGVRVNAVCPGPVQTPMMRSIEAGSAPGNPQAVSDQVIARNPSKRYGEPEEIARTVLFLASDAASYVNGAAWLIDGGRTAV
jgi:NAD(P)-dependent dehydrogenase (short-subunit alcohol dehydrogenase family)